MTQLRAPLLVLACLLAGALAVQGLAYAGTALSTPDAGELAKQLATAPVPIAAPDADPTGYAQSVVDAFRAGRWALLVVLGLFGVARALLWAAKKWDIAWLTRWAPVLVAASGVLASIGASLGAAGAIDWWAVTGAGAAALTLYLAPTPRPAPAS